MMKIYLEESLMSAISGMLSLNKNNLPHECVLQFNDVMSVQKHRGPDKTQFCSFNNNNEVFITEDIKQISSDFSTRGIIGHNLLCVNKTTDTAQPFCNKDKSVGVAYDGNFVNMKELRSDLLALGYSFETQADAEFFYMLI